MIIRSKDMLESNRVAVERMEEYADRGAHMELDGAFAAFLERYENARDPSSVNMRLDNMMESLWDSGRMGFVWMPTGECILTLDIDGKPVLAIVSRNTRAVGELAAEIADHYESRKDR